ncbi:MAG: 50S ribosomal protein L4 [bacterium]|nr:50S ribosomal protein L4 [bacterium]
MEHIVYNQEGKDVGKVTLPEAIFGAKYNADLLHQVSQSMLSNKRQGSAHTKNRGEVRGGGRKPWKQKGTGRARHGSSRSPIWVGGGVAHGPRNDKNYARKINRTMKRQALYIGLSKKLKDGEVLFLNGLAMPEIKTKDAKAVLSSLSKLKGFGALSKSKNAAYVIIPAKDTHVEKSFRNFPHIAVGLAKDLGLLDVLTYKYLVISNPEESIVALTRNL